MKLRKGILIILFLSNVPFTFSLTTNDPDEMVFTIDEDAVSSDFPSLTPSDMPSMVPSDSPSMVPSDMPSRMPSLSPSRFVSSETSLAPSDAPSIIPTRWAESSAKLPEGMGVCGMSANEDFSTMSELEVHYIYRAEIGSDVDPDRVASLVKSYVHDGLLAELCQKAEDATDSSFLNVRVHGVIKPIDEDGVTSGVCGETCYFIRGVFKLKVDSGTSEAYRQKRCTVSEVLDSIFAEGDAVLASESISVTLVYGGTTKQTCDQRSHNGDEPGTIFDSLTGRDESRSNSRNGPRVLSIIGVSAAAGGILALGIAGFLLRSRMDQPVPGQPVSEDSSPNSSAEWATA